MQKTAWGYTLRWILVALFIVVLDQASKWIVCRQLLLHQPVVIFPFFSLFLTYNTGAAFSLFSQAAGWQRWLLIATSVIVIVAILFWLRRLPRQSCLLPLALMLVLGGAIGNLIDRMTLGYVIDFLLLHWQQWQWPVFNIADSAICLGTGLLGLQLLKK